MLKQKGPGYTSQMKAKVSYPKLKTKEEKNNKPKVEINDPAAPSEASPIPDERGGASIVSVKAEEVNSVGGSSKKPADHTPTIIRKETVTISRQASPNLLPSPLDSRSSVKSSPSVSNRSSMVIEEQVQSPSSDEAADEEKPLKKVRPPKNATLSRGPGTFRKTSTFVKKQVTDRQVPTKDDVIAFVENDAIFNSIEHRREIMNLVENYTKQARRKQLMEILEHPVFEDTSCLTEVVGLLQEFVTNKTNNNC